MNVLLIQHQSYMRESIPTRLGISWDQMVDRRNRPSTVNSNASTSQLTEIPNLRFTYRILRKMLLDAPTEELLI